MIRRISFILFLVMLVKMTATAGKPVIGYPEIRLANFEKMQEIIDQGTDLNAFDAENMSPLFLASWLGEDEVAKFLVSNGANVNLTRNDGVTPIFLSRNGEMIDTLIGLGANINHTTPNGITPLTSAILRHDIRIAEYLVNMGADVNVMKQNGRTPLSILNERKDTPLGKREEPLRQLIIAKGGKDITMGTNNKISGRRKPNSGDVDCHDIRSDTANNLGCELIENQNTR